MMHMMERTANGAEGLRTHADADINGYSAGRKEHVGVEAPL